MRECRLVINDLRLQKSVALYDVPPVGDCIGLYSGDCSKTLVLIVTERVWWEADTEVELLCNVHDEKVRPFESGEEILREFGFI